LNPREAHQESAAANKTKVHVSSPFPEDFLWGASTSGHQVEGANYNQWTVWELENASKMARVAADRLRWMPDWLKFKSQAEMPENYVSGKAVDHYHLYKEDFSILERLGLNAFRFGIEWSRIEPEAGQWDQAEIDHYHNYISELQKRGIEPVLNIWHWTNPVWFENMGGFSRRENIALFERFVGKLMEEYGSMLRYVITINEPNIYISYPEWNQGVNVPPQQPRWKRLMTLFWLVRAHKRAYSIIKRANPDIRVGAAVQMAHNRTKRDNLLSRVAVKFSDKFGNNLFYDLTKKYTDFIGFNYYFTNYFEGFKLKNPPTPTNDMGWYMEPEGIGDVITNLWLRYHKPVMVTENGVADSADKYRQWWLKTTMLELLKARRNGVNLIGYFHWSLLDNFEWANGWWPKFGLVSVDRENKMKRTIRPSALWWSKQLDKIRRT
jgi:beta-glucosidase